MTTLTFNQVLSNEVKIPGIESIREFNKQKVTNQNNKINIIIESINMLANKVESNWGSFDSNRQEELIDFAYTIIEPEEFNLITKIYDTFLWFKICLFREKDEYLRFCKAMDTLIDNILNAIECSDPNFQDSIMVEVNKIVENPDLGETVNSGNISDKLRELRDQAFS